MHCVLQQLLYIREPVGVRLHEHMVRKAPAVAGNVFIVLLEVQRSEIQLGGRNAVIELAVRLRKGQCERRVLLRTIETQLVGLHIAGEVVHRLLGLLQHCGLYCVGAHWLGCGRSRSFVFT